MTTHPLNASIVVMKRQFAPLCALLLAAGFMLAAPASYAQNIQVFNGADVDFGQWLPGDGNQSNSQFFCVYKDSGDTFWDVEVNGSGAGGAFELTDGTNTLPIDNIDIRFSSVSPGVIVTNRPDADNTGSADCTEYGGDNQELQIDILGSDLGSVPPGIYTGNVSVTVTP